MTVFRRRAAAAFAMGAIAFLAVLTAPVVASAQMDAGLKAVGAATALTTTDPRVIAARIINYALSMMGIVMVSLMIYAGFLWMTSGGDPEKVDKAKTMIRNAIIGAVIILSAWGITTYVIRRLLEAAGRGGGGGSVPVPTCVGPACGFGTPPGPTGFQVRSITPSGSVPIRNVVVSFLFTRDVDARTADASIRVLTSAGASVEGRLAVTGSVVTFTPSAACPAPAADRRCFDADADYVARVAGSLRSSTGQVLACGGFAPPCFVNFRTGRLIDTQNPSVAVLSPFDGQNICTGGAVRVSSRATDDLGVSRVETFVDSRSVGVDAPTATTTTLTFDASAVWDASGAATGTHSLQSTVRDIASNSGTSRSVSVALRVPHCCNGRQDADEAGVDCGGLECGSCSGGACTAGTDCWTGVCSGGRCVERPVITGFSPPNGRPGTIVTVAGANFGSASGTVRIGGAVASAPEACVGLGISLWSMTQAIVVVPLTARTGPIELTNVASGLSDRTNDDTGPRLDDYVVNTTARPGICAAVPDHAGVNASIRFPGVGFGGTRGRIFFNDREIGPSVGETWADNGFSLNAPVLSPAPYGVRAQVGGVDSNSVAFRLDEPVTTGPPIIDSIDPASGPIGEYVTLTGRNFGDRVGSVRFQNAGGESGAADTSFPPICATSYWRNNTVVVKVPGFIGALGHTSVINGPYQVVLRRQEPGAPPSNVMAFSVGSGVPRPGVCAVLPNVGPIDTPVRIIGDRFGSTLGSVLFSGTGTTTVVETTVAADAWTNQEIRVRVPARTVTGNVKAKVGAIVSNGVLYSVQNCNERPDVCRAGEMCCAGSGACSVGGICPVVSLVSQYAWRTSTGIIPMNPEVVEECSATTVPSPTPWGDRAGGNRACLNASLLIRFTTKIDPATVTPLNIIVRKCTGAAPDPCTAATTVTPRAGYPRKDPADTETDYVTFLPTAAWDPAGTYQVILTTGIRSDTASGNLPMLANPARCGTGNAYCFRFVTRAGTEACIPGSVTVAPVSFTAKEINETIPHAALPRSGDDICMALDGSTMHWNWDTAGDLRATLPSPLTRAPTGNVSNRQTVTAREETGPTSHVPVRAGLTPSGSAPITGVGRLFIRFVPPRVEEKGPDCDTACINASIWVRFNVSMLADSFIARRSDTPAGSRTTLSLQRCRNENCRTFDRVCDLRVLSLTSAPDAPSGSPINYLRLSHDRCLEPGRYYKMLLRGGSSGIQSATRLFLTELNDPEGYAWIFKTKIGDDARCRAARVDVLPAQKIETEVGARQMFSGQPVGSPDACNPQGQPLDPDMSFAWRSTDLGVARLWNNGTMDTTPRLSPHCSDRCLKTGADGPMHTTADCGNSIVETTDANYCISGRTPSGASCRLMPSGSSAGEECDLGGRNGSGSSCGAECLWNGTRAVVDGGTCGNGTIEAGEQCDTGRACSGGTAPGQDCATDAVCGAGGLCRTVERRGCAANCLSLGSQAGGSTCGNGGALGDGEACDDGNAADRDGCSGECLHEGSRAVVSVCGNGALEDGEACESSVSGGALPAGCDPQSCLHLGTNPTAVTGGTCGNGVVDAGEDCDGGPSGRQGCSNRCLLLGSSVAYRVPSFCGNGSPLETGEQCESLATGGDRLVDGAQLAEITGTREPGADGRMTSNIEATYDARTGNGVYGLQCGYTQESSCRAGFGLTTNGCCSARPAILSNFPAGGAINVCRNTLIWAQFSVPMEPSSISQNMIVAELGNVAVGCPTGTRSLDRIALDASGWRGWMKRAWRKMTQFFRVNPAQADPFLWCAGGVTGSMVVRPEGAGSRVNFVMQNALKANTRYRILFRGDSNLVDAVRQGIRTMSGVVVPADSFTSEVGSFSWTFTTGPSICVANQLNIRDTVATSPFLFTRASEVHPLEATVMSMRDGAPVPIVPVAEYGWAWDPWVSSKRDVLAMGTATVHSDAISTADATAQAKNGSLFVTAQIRITRDTIRTPSTRDQLITSSRPASVILCERPWPSLLLAPFSDSDRSPSLVALAPSFAGGPFMNFSTLYCMDVGATGPDGDLPPLVVHALPTDPSNTARGIIREYLFTFAEERLRGDGIGIRIAANPLHLSALSWYRAQGFSGAPESITVDGYDAIRDGNTVYVAGSNTDGSATGRVYSNIYVISRNPDAKEETVNIYDQLVQSWMFNVNLERDSQNACVGVSGAYVLRRGVPVECTADWECASGGDPTARCASFKAKLQRDTRRIADFQLMTNALEGSRQRSGKYPLLNNGTYLQTIATSRWTSWSDVLAAEIQSSLPQDPVNRYVTCGTCRTARTNCTTDSDCPETGDTCVPRDGYDPGTCWNAATRRYLCPRSGMAMSHVYQYRAVDGGSRYELSSELEGPAPARYDPPLVLEINRCSNTGQVCDPSRSDGCTIAGAPGRPASSGTCGPTGGRWRYQGLCTGSVVGVDGVCGNGVRGIGEQCELNETLPIHCQTADGRNGTKLQICSDCRAWVNGPATICIADSFCGNGRVDARRCYGAEGMKYGQACTADTECRDPRDPAVVSAAMTCRSVTTVRGVEEVCDDGALNGTYGHCNRTCTGFDAFCGDGQFSLGETCDNGTDGSSLPAPHNGDYCGVTCDLTRSCGLDCRSRAPHCGDNTVQAPQEQCDGGREQTALALCVGGGNADRPCSTNADCAPVGGAAGVCGGTGLAACTTRVGRCSNAVPTSCVTDRDCPIGGVCLMRETRHTRSCVAPASGSVNQCNWEPWTDCLPIGSCGDGAVDAGEECDDGNDSNNDGCTNQCKRNVCGDGFQFRGAEDCDYGSARNTGEPIVQADYGSTALGCSSVCRQVTRSGGYCGDGVKNGAEQCDRRADGTPVGTENITCRSLGYDYADQTRCVHQRYLTDDQGRRLCAGRQCCCGEGTSAGAWGTYIDPDAESPVCGPTGLAAFIDPENFAGSTGCRAHNASTSPEPVPVLLADYVCEGSRSDVLACTNTCGYSGCHRCQDDPGNGAIDGTVKDAVYSNMPVPNARVTLYLRGSRVAETFTNGDGRFEFRTINTRPECGQYRIIVDFYQDNPCTGPDGDTRPTCSGQHWPTRPADDESRNGGYWPYESDVFNVTNFASVGLHNRARIIHLAPRVGPNETLVIHTWDGELDGGRYLDAHLIVPVAMSFNQTTFVPCSETGCIRDVGYHSRGLRNLNESPHAYLYCVSSGSGVGSDAESCTSFVVAPETTKYKRGNWGLTGWYSYVLVDYSSRSSPASYRYFNDKQSQVRIVTQDRVYVVRPPARAPSCGGGKYWLVFQQRADTGAIEIQNQTGMFACNGTTFPNEGSATFNGPLQSVGT